MVQAGTVVQLCCLLIMLGRPRRERGLLDRRRRRVLGLGAQPVRHRLELRGSLLGRLLLERLTDLADLCAPVSAIDAALSKAKGVTTHTLECRTELCQIRLSTSTRAQALNAWRTLTSDPAIRELSDGFMHEAGDPVVDLATGKGGFDVDLYLFTRSAADAANDIEAFVAQFRASGVIERCADAGDDRGVLEVRISVAADDASLTIAIGGSLAGTAVGRCISERLEDEVHRHRLPAGSRYGVVYASILSPRGE